jgi:hypothetical protein
LRRPEKRIDADVLLAEVPQIPHGDEVDEKDVGNRGTCLARLGRQEVDGKDRGEERRHDQRYGPLAHHLPDAWVE